MKIQNIKMMVLVVLVFVALCGFGVRAHADGRQIFLDAKCNKCHKAGDIALLPKDPASEEDEDEDAEEGEKKIDPPDLKGDSILKTFGGTPDTVMTKLPPFLRKEAAIEVGEFKGKKHKKKATLTDEQYKELIPWLLKL